MSAVLDFLREQDPRLKEVPDEELTRFAAETTPEFLKDEEFKKDYARLSPLTAPRLVSDGLKINWPAAANDPAPPDTTGQYERLKELYEARRAIAGDDPRLRQAAQTEFEAGLRQLGIEPISDLPSPITSAGRIIGPPLARGGKFLGAVAGDITDAMADDLVRTPEDPVPLANLSAFATRPEAPLPITEELNRMPAWARLPGKVTQATVQALPRLGVAAAGGMAGLTAPVANVAAMGFDEQGNIDPIGVLAATGLPLVDKLGRQVAAATIQKMLAKPIVITQPGELAAKVAAHYPALQKEAVQKALEITGGQLANNAYLLALQTPGILQAENPAQALEDALVGNVALSIMGAAELNRGRSLTAEQLSARAQRGEPLLNVELQRPSPAPAQPVTKNVTPQSAPTPARAASGVRPPAEQPAPAQPSGIVPGKPTTILGANDAKLPAVYAWAPASSIQASHGGESFSVNPAYAPLKNTRRYDTDPAERDKVLKGATGFEPYSYATNVKGAAEGPVMVSQGTDGVLRVLGGNGRWQMIQRLSPEQREQFGAVQDEEAATFGLPPRPSPDHVLVRLLPGSDLTTPAGIEAANRTIDLLNPSPGLVESTASMARNDAAKVPAAMLNQIRPDATPAQMRQWITGLLTDGTLDRNTRTQIAANDAQLTDYVQRLLVQAAYHSDVVNEFRHDAKTGETTRALIDTGIPFLTELRAKGEGATAQAFTELVTRAADYQRQNPERKLDDILQQIHAQAEANETAHGTLARGLALALSGQVERLPANKRGERKIDPDETANNFQMFFEALARSVKAAEAVPDLFGNTRTPSEAIADFIRGKVGDEPVTLSEPAGEYRAGPDPRVVKLNKLEAARRERKLTAAEEKQRAALEVALGQNFMAFHHAQQGREQDAAALERQQAIAAAQQQRLTAGQLESQPDFFAPPPDQPTLFEPAELQIDTGAIEAYLKGYGVPDATRKAHGISRALSSVATPEMARRLEEGSQGELFSGDAPGQPNLRPNAAAVPDESTQAARAALSNPTAAAADFARAFQSGDTVSSILTKVLSRQIPGFDLRGQIIRTHLDYVLLTQSLRTPYFETFKAVLINQRGRIVASQILTVGSVNATVAGVTDLVLFIEETKRQHPGPLRLITSHNHPGGLTDPSDHDVHFSPQLTEAAQAAGVEHFDDIITDGDEFYSFKEERTIGIPKEKIVQPEWELVPRKALRRLDNEQQFRHIAESLRAASPTHHHILYLNTRRRLTAVQRLPQDLSGSELAKELVRTAALQGAPAVMVDFAPALSAAAAENNTGIIWRQLRRFKVQLLDASSRTVPSMRALGLLHEAPRPAAGGALREKEQQYSTSAITISFANAPVKSGTVPLAMGGMQHIKPVEMPELVRLATELMGGQQPGLKKFKKAAGMFYHGPGGVAIKLDPRLFVNSADAAKVLAHEIGHLIDYLPTATLKRGNLVGRLHTLRSFLKNSFGPGAVTNKELRAELIALTQYWHPYNPATVPAHYKAYRESAAELYADALSVLLNSPGLLEQMAPKFYREFWKEIDRKPEVKQALFDLQDLLNKGKIPVLEQRAADRETMFTRGDEILKRKAAEREARRKSWRGYWLELKQALFDKFEPVVQKARQAEQAGASFPAGRDPRHILEEGAMTDNANARFVRRIFEGVVKPVEDAGITTLQLGDYLFLRRVQAGDRSTLANPLGTTPETARLGLLKMRLDLGIEAMTRLETAVQEFHEIVFEAVEEAVAVGSYNKDVFESRIKPNKDVYAAFAVLDYLEDYVPAGVKEQVGTLKEIANPFTATVLKTVALNNLNSIQRSKNATRDLLRNHFQNEIEAAKGRFIALGFTERPPPKADKGILQVLEDGRPAYYYVDPLIAHAFERQSPQELGRVLRVLDYVFRKGFYRLYITYSPSFLTFNPVRDFKRAWKSLPAGTGRLQLARAYFDVFRSAVSHVRGVPDGLATEMIANYAIGTPLDALVSSHRDDPLGDIMRRFHLLPARDEAAFWQTHIGRPIRAIGRAMEFFGQLQEALPKMAGYRLLRKDFGLPPSEAATQVRNHFGTPNVFKKGTAVQVVRAFAPFYNVFAQGWRADLHKMRPRSQSGWWFKWAASDGLWAVLTGLAAGGLLGAALKELLGGVSEYDKTNYNVLPVGYSIGGDHGRRIHYLRLPRDESSRLLSGLTYKLTRLFAGDSPEQLSDLLDFGAGQMPSVNPAVQIPAAWLQLASGHNPEDPFRGRPIIPRTEFEAGGIHTLEPMFLWTVDQSGAGNFVRWNAEAQSTMELTMSAIPGLKSLYKVSDFGYREQQMAAENAEAQQRAIHRLSLPDDVRQLSLEYSRLKNIDLTRRTPAQEARYTALNIWHNTVYRKYDELIWLSEQARQSADGLRQQMLELSKPYVVKP